MEPLDYCSNFLIGGYNSDGSTRLYSLVEEDELLASIRGRIMKKIDVFNEIKNNQIKWGISDYHFYDDNLMINPEWVDQFTELIISTGLKINWICLSRPEIILKHKDLLPKI